MSYICQSFSVQEDWIFGGRQFTYNSLPLAGLTITIGYTGNAWIDPISGPWNVSTTFSLAIRNDTGRINSTPRAVTAPIIRLLEGCNHTLSLAVSDPDGDMVRCRWAVGAECASICGLPGAVLHSNTCVIEYPADRGTRFWGVALMLEDFTPESPEPLSSVALQFLVLVTPNTEGSCSQGPTLVPPTLRSGSCIAIPPGTTFTSQVVTNSSSSGTSINEIQTIPPLGTTVGALTQLAPGSVTYYVNISWTPSSNQQNQTHLFCYTAIASDLLTSDQYCISLLPGYFPPRPLLATAFPSGQPVHPSNHTTWSVRFDTDIEQSDVMGNITFHYYNSGRIVYSIDASRSPEVTIVQPDMLTFTPSFSFDELTRFYITFDRHVVQGLVGCGPGNEPLLDKESWTFVTLDVTPPNVTFLLSPSVTNSNVSLSWESNENATWRCVLELGSVQSVVNCSGGFWMGYGLTEGQYRLQVRATDAAGNTAIVSHAFRVDLTPPITTILDTPDLVSNQRMPTLTFSCNESPCSYECRFTSIMFGGSFSPCLGGTFTTPSLQDGQSYNLQVQAIDSVGNRGEVVSYTWETDFQAPSIFGIQNTSAQCNETLPENTGQPQTLDNRPGNVSLMYNDVQVECYVSRTWRATDMAGNIGTLEQIVHLNFTPTVSLLHTVYLPCDSAASSLRVTNSTAFASNPCRLPLELSHVDSAQRCPGTFTRNWTISGCGRTTITTQTINLFDLCPPQACGRDESPPRGGCFFGQCQCNQPHYGENCDLIIYQPVLQQVNASTLVEGQAYATTVVASQGSPPLVWRLVLAPSGLLFDSSTGLVTWARARAGSYSVAVQVENQVGSSRVEWSLEVSPGYNATLSSVSSELFSFARPVVLSGYIEGPNVGALGSVPVLIDIVNAGVRRTVRAFTTNTGNFSLVFRPFSTEYGTYVAGARHPIASQSGPQVQWRVLGMTSIPERVVLNGAAETTFEGLFQNATFIYNDGPGPLSALRTSLLLPDTSELSVDVFLPLNTTLQPGEQTGLDIRIRTSRPLSGLFVVLVEAQERTTLRVSVRFQVVPILPSFSINPERLNSRLTRGLPRIFNFNITNVGMASADNVRVILPNTNVTSIVSFGNLQQTSGGSLTLRSGESAILSVEAQVPETHALGVLSGRLVISSDQTFGTIPITLTVSSNLLINLTVIVEDEYSYFASGRPLVSDAMVTLINRGRDLRLSLSTSMGNGAAEFIGVYEDRYELLVEAPSHTMLRQIIIASTESPEYVVFLQRQTVTYTWTVTPVTFQDIYVISLEADFETHVPIPVVTASPTEINLDDLERGLIASFQLNITNHGLIRAENVNIRLPSHPTLEFSSTGFLGDLEPLSSVLVSVHSSRRVVQKRQTAGRCGSRNRGIIVSYSYVCGERIPRSVPVILRGRSGEGGCNSRIGGLVSIYGDLVDSDPINFDGSLVSTDPFDGNPIRFDSGRGGGSNANPAASLPFTNFASLTPLSCSPCLNKLVKCAVPDPLDLAFSRLRFPLSGCIPLVIRKVNPISSVPNALMWAQCAWGNRWTGLALCAYNEGLFSACLRNTASRRRRRQNSRRSLNNVVEALYPIQQSMFLGAEVLGDDVWITVVEDSEWLSSVLQPTLEDESELGVLVSPAELSTILSAALPNGTTIEIVTRMVERVNNTLFGWSSGQLEPSEGSNMASFSRVQDLAQDINTYNAMMVDRGFSSYLDAYNFYANEANQIDDLEEEVGVCAVVRIRIQQELALTREAFLARLEIDNMEDSTLQELRIEISFTDTVTGEQATHRFSISNETISGSLTAMSDESWSLPSGGVGSLEWLIIPLSEAAPDADRVYNVGGSFNYIVDDENISVPLAPNPITVRPDPSLLVHYFWERYVVADNPFTEEVEPSVPFTLGVAVKNAGYGTANSLQISSAQPEIIDNERGLLIDFKIVGANIGSANVTPSLTVMFGDLAPNTTMVARWFMISSLQGEFMRYSATFENINPLGDPRLSVLDDLEIHELIRNVDMYTASEEDGVLDFLANDYDDLLAYPDVLYSSRNLQRYNVSVGTVDSLQMNLQEQVLVVTTSSNSSGWVYYRHEDMANILSNMASQVINASKQDANDTVFLPAQNFWLTRDGEERSLHILDYLEDASEVIFTLELCTVNCSSAGVPFDIPTTVQCKNGVFKTSV